MSTKFIHKNQKKTLKNKKSTFQDFLVKKKTKTKKHIFHPWFEDKDMDWSSGILADNYGTLYNMQCTVTLYETLSIDRKKTAILT